MWIRIPSDRIASRLRFFRLKWSRSLGTSLVLMASRSSSSIRFEAARTMPVRGFGVAFYPGTKAVNMSSTAVALSRFTGC